MHKLEKLFNPQSVAIVGASEEEGKVGRAIAKNVLELGYAGKVFLVNSKRQEMFGQKCFATLAEIGEEVDLAIIVIPAKFVADVISSGSEIAKNFVVISAGFGETDEDGHQRERELAEIAKNNNVNILGPNCLGFIAPGVQLNASFAGGMPAEGNISFVSQSGAIAVALMDIANKEGMKFSNIISIGNKMQIDEAELLEYLSADSKTKVIGMYLEGIKDGQKFVEVARKVSKTKPIVILKAGKSVRAQQAISSHTGALAGSDATTGALLEKAGVIRAESMEEFFQIVQLISIADVADNNQVVVITNAGGPGVLATDAFEGKKIALTEFDENIKNELREILPAESSVENPIDLLGDAQEDRYAKVLQVIGKEKLIGTVICLLTPQDQTPVLKVAEAVINFKNTTHQKVVAVFVGGERVIEAENELKANGVPIFDFPEQAIGALEKYYQWNLFQQKAAMQANGINQERGDSVRKIITNAKEEERGALSFAEAKVVMEMYGVKTVEVRIVDDAEKEKCSLPFPVVAKVDSDKVLHKTDKQGLILNIQNQAELVVAIEKMEQNFPGAMIILQPMLARQTELIVGIKNDPSAGPLVVYGLGGIYTEVFKMVDFLVPPLNSKEIVQYLEKSKIAFLFKETRGKTAGNGQEMAGILAGICQLAMEVPEILELDINPLLVYNDKDAVAVDVKIIF